MALDLISLTLGLVTGAGAAALYAHRHAQKNVQTAQDLAQKIARLEAEKTATEQRLADTAQTAEKMTLQFENLANRIFEEKTEKFKKDSKEGIDQILAPLRERLGAFQQKVEESFSLQAREQYSLKNEIARIVNVNEQMRLQTESLTKALKSDSKAQGNWGEMILEKILEDSGLRKDADYTLQGAGMKLKHADDGSHAKPDVIVHLPEGKSMIIDAKVSLTAYERFCAAQDDAQKTESVRQFLESVRRHVAELESRRYQDAAGLDTPDFVLMFMPIEGAYALAVQEDTTLHAHAWEKRIVLVSPTTLFATLKTVAAFWRIVQQERHAGEIAREGGMLYDKIAGFVEDMQKLGNQIQTAQRTYDDTFKKLAEGRGNILRRTEKLKEMGVKASKALPPALTGAAATADENSPDTQQKTPKAARAAS